jgi:hypothetical protein
LTVSGVILEPGVGTGWIKKSEPGMERVDVIGIKLLLDGVSRSNFGNSIDPRNGLIAQDVVRKVVTVPSTIDGGQGVAR